MKNLPLAPYELKAVKYFEARNGYGMYASIYKGKKKIGKVFDAGDGSMMEVTIEDETEKPILAEFITKNLSNVDGVIIDKKIPPVIECIDLVIFVGLLESDKENRDVVKKGRNEKTYFGLKDDELLEDRRFATSPYNKKVVEYLNKTHGDNLAYIGNEVFDIYPDDHKES